MKVKELKDILSKMKDEEDVVFDRYDHFSDKYECYDFNGDVTYCTQGSWSNIIGLKRLEEDDDKLIEDPNAGDDDSSEEMEKISAEEIWDDMVDSDFVASL